MMTDPAPHELLTSDPSADVRVTYRKFDGSLHWHQYMRRLGEDEHGVWLGAPPGAHSRRAAEPPVLIGSPHVMLFPADAWWTGSFNGEPSRLEIYCDVTTPPQWLGPSEVTMIDLDLDVVRVREDRRVALLDEDEFAEHLVRFSYPAEVVAQAWNAARLLREALRIDGAGAEPFQTAYLDWLKLVTD
jgi:uncharacterized protein